MLSLRFLCLFFGCALVAQAKLVVVSANTILADFVRVVGGDRVEGVCLLTPGMDPHSFEPKPADIGKISRAKLVVVNGLGLEGWQTKLITHSGFQGEIVVATTGVDVIALGQAKRQAVGTTGAAETGEPDPHAWHDPRQARHYVENIRDALKRIDPADAQSFDENTSAYLQRLDELYQYGRKAFSGLLVERRKLVTSHDALGYFARAFDLTIVPVGGLNPDQEPTAKHLAQLIKFIREQHVRGVFFESTSNPKFVQLIADEAGVKVVQQLYTDSLGEAGSTGATYLEMVRSNVDVVVQALK